MGHLYFTGNNWQDDRYLESDHAWGGGIDLKYFFHRYFGVCIEGWIADARRTFDEINGFAFRASPSDLFSVPPPEQKHESRAVGSVLGTLTLRYPIPCTRFAPYLFAGGGGIFGGGEKTNVVVKQTPELPPFGVFRVQTHQTGSQTQAIGQFGGGIEIRLTPHIGWINDFSWNVVDGPNNNFGMVRTGVNFAF